jgi:hypothetical protein
MPVHRQRVAAPLVRRTPLLESACDGYTTAATHARRQQRQRTMRILFLHHFPLEESEVGRLIARWSAALVLAGHETRALVVDSCRREEGPLRVDRVVCHAGNRRADLPFDVPQFGGGTGTQPGGTFRALTDDQLTRYREHLRRRLDALVDRFNPHVIHVQYIWVLGQLAVETGVPYAINAWGPEIDDRNLDARYRSLADQAAANAGRVLTPDRPTLERVEGMFELEPGQALVLPDALRMNESTDPAADAAALVGVYQELLDERFGAAP